MIQDIYPRIFQNEYKNTAPDNDSIVVCFINNKILSLMSDTTIHFPSYKELKEYRIEKLNKESSAFHYLFTIDKTSCYLLLLQEEIEMKPYTYEHIRSIRYATPKYLAFTGVTAYHLYTWYRDNRFCGRCGSTLQPDNKERMLHCSDCNNTVYPKIAPAVIVGVIAGDKILMTKYAGRDYTNYALIAGFTEIGETAENTVKREVMEEAGLKVKNITYYKSQPWGFDSNLLLGYYAELDGDDTITLDQDELSEARWFSRDEIAEKEDDISLTREMIINFKNNGFKF